MWLRGCGGDHSLHREDNTVNYPAHFTSSYGLFSNLVLQRAADAGCLCVVDLM